MDVLVLGGSVFVGRAVVSEAQALGAQVTVFNRGVSGATDPDVEHITGDRTSADDLRQLENRSFDVVVDTCGYTPADVRASADLLATNCGRYAFVSSINAYPGWPEQLDYRAGGSWDGDPDATKAPDDLDPRGSYGWQKVGCERAASRAFGDRASILRAGCIVGPHDSAVGRLPYWLYRVARGGDVLAPGSPDQPVSLIDARDLARFALTGPAGLHDCGGPAGRDTMGGLLDACTDVTGSDARIVWVDESWLLDQGVAYWTELPLWAPAAEAPGAWAHDSTPELAFRPLAETVRDTWAWLRPIGWTPTAMTPGLTAEREAELLAAR